MGKPIHIKVHMANSLLQMLHDCNLAGVKNYDGIINDLPLQSSSQFGTYGHIAEALKSLGYVQEYVAYCETGEVVKIEVPE